MTLCNSQKATRKGPKIAIIGAGMAGLSAAKRLTELGYSNFHVFEGSDRIGGRIHPIAYLSLFTDGGYLQMGAQFLNGSDNPVFEIARDLGVVSEPVSDLAHFDEAQFIYGDQPVDQRKIPRFFCSIQENGRGLYVTLFTEDYEHFLHENKISGHRRNVFDALTRSYRSYWEFEWAADWTDLSLSVLRHWNDGGPVGESYATDKIGYTAILDLIYNSTPHEVFHFNCRIGNIDYSGEKIQLTLDDERNLTGFDYVIVTSSLGHLKKFNDLLFTPPLPEYKKDAIEKIGFGGSCKIFFRWEHKFWQDDCFSIAPLPVKGMARRDIDPFERELTTLQVVDWEPNTLMAWIAGAGHEVMDELSDEEIRERVTRLIRDMMSDQSIEPPAEIIRSRLTKNDLLCGSYSYLSKAQAEAGISTEWLERPITVHGAPRLLFAGEATHNRLFQTAIGAYLSGVREVDRIVNLEERIRSRL